MVTINNSHAWNLRFWASNLLIHTNLIFQVLAKSMQNPWANLQTHDEHDILKFRGPARK